LVVSEASPFIPGAVPVVKRIPESHAKEFLQAFHYTSSVRGGGVCLGVYAGDPVLRGVVVLHRTTVDGGAALEVTRCALLDGAPKNFASQVLAKVVKQFQETTFVAFSDTSVGHTGTMYRAAGWECMEEQESTGIKVGDVVVSGKYALERAWKEGVVGELVRVKKLKFVKRVQQHSPKGM
jgi:hypothetical protein